MVVFTDIFAKTLTDYIQVQPESRNIHGFLV
jgi:hypothetical protein